MRAATLALAVSAVATVSSAPAPKLIHHASEARDTIQSEPALERRSPEVNVNPSNVINIIKDSDKLVTDSTTSSSRFATDGHPVGSTVMGHPPTYTHLTSYPSQPYHYGYSGYSGYPSYNYYGHYGQPHTSSQASYYHAGVPQGYSHTTLYQQPDNRSWAQEIWDWVKAHPIQSTMLGGIVASGPIIATGIKMHREAKEKKQQDDKGSK